MELKSTAPYIPPPPPLPPYSETTFQNVPQSSPYSYPYPGTPWPPNHPGLPPYTEINFRDDHMMPTNSEVPLVLEVHKSKRGIRESSFSDFFLASGDFRISLKFF